MGDHRDTETALAAPFRSGFVALTGCPNVGKSSLLNRLVGQKVTIVADVPQTTRHRIRGIRNGPDHQVVFVDTPGIHAPHRRLTKVLVRAAESAIADVDLVLFVVEPPPLLIRLKKFGRRAVLPPLEVGPGDRAVLRILEERLGRRGKVVLVINKIDLIHKEHLLPLIDTYRREHEFVDIVPVSALRGLNTERLLSVILDYLPEEPPMYPSDMITDRSEAFRVGEIIREKVFEQTRAEVPYSVAVVVDHVQEQSPAGPVVIHASLYVERPSHKGILIGAKGSRLREIGRAARKEVERLLGKRVYLELIVRVRKNWRDRDPDLRRFGYHEE